MIRLENRIPPPVIDVAFAGLMWWLARAFPSAQLWRADATVWPSWVAAVFGLAGLASALAGLMAFRRARTTVNPLTPTRASMLVSSGIYRHTRNPMYLGMLLVLAGWGVWLGHALALLMLPLFVLTLNRLQIEAEERALRARFGEAFTQYAARVRRWI